MKNIIRTIALILSAVMLLASLAACGAIAPSTKGGETEVVENAEDAPFGEGAEVNEAQFEIATSAEAFENMTTVTRTVGTYTMEDGRVIDNDEEEVEYYNNDYVYEEDTFFMLTFNGNGRVDFYQVLDQWTADYYTENGRGEFTVDAWNYIDQYSENTRSAGDHFVYISKLGRFKDYTFDEASGKYISEKPVDATYGKITHRELTFEDGVLVEYTYHHVTIYSNGDINNRDVTVTLKDYGKTDPKLPEELVKLMEEHK